VALPLDRALSRGAQIPSSAVITLGDY